MKILFFVLYLFFVVGDVMAQEAFVRKKREPAFFIPESAKIQPERLVMPRYHLADDLRPKTEIKYSTKPIVKETTEAKQEPQIVVRYNNNEVKEETPEVITHNLMENFAKSPSYKNNYQSYAEDLKHISQTGQLPINNQLQKDLSQMNSERRIVVEKKPLQINPKEKFEEVLKQTLSSNQPNLK